jgi:hypothetical protein
VSVPFFGSAPFVHFAKLTPKPFCMPTHLRGMGVAALYEEQIIERPPPRTFSMCRDDLEFVVFCSAKLRDADAFCERFGGSCWWPFPAIRMTANALAAPTYERESVTGAWASLLLPRSPPPPQQPDNSYDDQQNERVYKSIRTIHCRTSVLPPRCQTTFLRLRRFPATASPAVVTPFRNGDLASLLLPQGLPHQQPDNDYDAHQDEQGNKRIVIRHCRIISLPHAIRQPSRDWAGSSHRRAIPAGSYRSSIDSVWPLLFRGGDAMAFSRCPPRLE